MKNNLGKAFIGFCIITCIGTLAACQSNKALRGEWLIPIGEVLDGGPGKDGIPSVDKPQFVGIEAAASDWDEQTLVVGIKVGGQVKAYPHPILDWHEIVNDEVGGKPIALNYCPLTGTAMAWNSTLNGMPTTFGVSGLLYNSNIIPFDRLTESNWSQIALKAVNGDLSGTEPVLQSVIELPWGIWKNFYPESLIMTKETGHSRNYSTYPYGDYRGTSRLLFPVSQTDDRLPNKERVLGIIHQNQAKVYRFSHFPNGPHVIMDSLSEGRFVIVGSQDGQFMIGFQSITADGTQLQFEAVKGSLPQAMKDQEGNIWDVLGEAVSGPRMGQHLLPAKAMMGYWFAFPAFYESVSIYP